MKAIIAILGIAATIAGAAATPAHAGRAVNTALGTLSGLVVFGPVGAVAGAAVGYTAGKGISCSWGMKCRKPARRSYRRR
ncbi:MAG: hypothetical protein ABWZ27_02930 [Aestuariivirgaceae bacterium]|jgi:hypothetical protein